VTVPVASRGLIDDLEVVASKGLTGAVVPVAPSVDLEIQGVLGFPRVSGLDSITCDQARGLGMYIVTIAAVSPRALTDSEMTIVFPSYWGLE
jgi:hypothetical protein